jgi:ribonuclease P protein component
VSPVQSGGRELCERMEQHYTFPKTHRIRSREEFSAVFDEGVKQVKGALLVFGRANGLAHPRLGLSISRRVGNAVKRNRIKRMLREAFRLMQHDLPRGYDFVVVVRPHEPMILAEYQRLLSGMFLKVHAGWERRSGGGDRSDAGTRSPYPLPKGEENKT